MGPRPEVQLVERQVPRVMTEAREQIVEVPQVLYEERLVEMPQVQTAEVVRQVPLPQVRTVQKPIPRIETQVVEKVVQVPALLRQEKAVEVPQVMTCEVLKQVAAAAQQQRIIQTGVQWEQAVAREAVVEAVGQMQYAGVYDAGVVGVREGGLVAVEPVVTRGETIVQPMVEHLRAVQTGPIEALEVVQPIRTEYMQTGAISQAVGHEYVLFGGQQLPFFADHHLRTLHPTKLREHAMLLHRHVGHGLIGAAVPINDAELLQWILNVQRMHLAPLRTAGALTTTLQAAPRSITTAPLATTLQAAPRTIAAPLTTMAATTATASLGSW